MTSNQIERFDKVKDKENEVPEEESEKQQSKGYLLVYLKKVDDEKDVPENTIEELIEVNLDLEDFVEKKGAGRSLINKSRKGKVTKYLRRNKDIFAQSHRDILGV